MGPYSTYLVYVPVTVPGAEQLSIWWEKKSTDPP